MKNKKIQDERVTLQKQKVSSDAFGILFYGLLISVLIQQFIFNAPFAQYAVEWILFIVASIYIIIRNITVGNNLFGCKNNGQKMVVINSIISGITIAIVATTLNIIDIGFQQMGGLYNIVIVFLKGFACGTLPSFIIWETFYLINRKRQKQLDEKYSDE